MKDVKDLRYERGQLADEMKAILDTAEKQGRDLNAAEQKQFDALNTRQASLQKQIERFDISNGLQVELNAPAVVGRRTNPEGQGYSPPASSKFVLNQGEVDFLRFGSKAGLSVKNSMSIGTDTDGGYTVVPELSRLIIETIAETNPILANSGRVMIASNEYQQLFTVSGAASGRVAEKGTRSETDSPTVERQSISLSVQYALPQITEELLMASEFDIGAFVTREIATAFDADWEAEMISGNGTAPNQKGFITAADSTDGDATRDFTSYQISKTAASATAITSDEVLDLIHSLPLRYRKNAKLYASSECLALLRKLKDGESRYLLLDPGAMVSERQSILGYPVVEVPQMAAVATGTKPLAFGDMSQAYTFVSHSSGLQVLRDPFTSPGYVKFYARLLCGSGPMDTRALKVLQMA